MLHDLSILFVITLVSVVNAFVLGAAGRLGAPPAAARWFVVGSIMLALSPLSLLLAGSPGQPVAVIGFNVFGLLSYTCWLIGALQFCGVAGWDRRLGVLALALAGAVVWLTLVTPDRELRVLLVSLSAGLLRLSTGLVLWRFRSAFNRWVAIVFAAVLVAEAAAMLWRGFTTLGGAPPMIGTDVRASSMPIWLTMLLSTVVSAPLLLLLSLSRTIEDLRRSGERLQATLAALPDAVFEIDAEGRYDAVRARDGHALGSSPQALLGQRPEQVLPAAAAEALAATLADVDRRGVSVGGQYALDQADGRHWFELSVAARAAPSAGYVVLARDITERVAAADALRYRTALFRHLFELSPIGLVLSELESARVLEANPAFLVQARRLAGTETALNYADLFADPARELPRVSRELRRAGLSGPSELECLRGDGETYPALFHALALVDPRGTTLVWSIFEDISERRRVDRLKDAFISTVSHELRTPLTAINGALGLLAGGASGRFDGATQGLLEIARRNGVQLTLLINDLLDLDKLVSGKLRLELQAQPLRPLLQQALEAVQTYSGATPVALRLKAPEAEIAVEVDGRRLLQVLANLLSNAIKFSPPEGAEVELSAKLDGERVRIAVRDHGSGVPEAFRPQLFEKFTQADGSDTRARGGSGLGLSIVRELVQQMGGTVGYEPPIGGGACFVVELPLAATS